MNQPEMTMHQFRRRQNSTKPNASFYQNSSSFSGIRTLLVEGNTDQRLIKKIASTKRVQIKVYSSTDNETQQFHNNYQSFRQNFNILSHSPNSIQSNKEAIISLLQTHDNLYGLVDLDFDDLECNGHLLVTDTHDIETLMLSTDLELMTRLDIDSDCLKKAYFMAYQLGIVRLVMHTHKYKSNIPQTSNLFSLFDKSSYKLSLDKLRSHMENNCNQQYISQIIEELSIGDFFENGEWSCSLSEFDHDNTDFWKIVNGHDILTLICCLLPHINQKYNRIHLNPHHIPDRKFETELINQYDTSCFANTKLYHAMKLNKLVA